MAGLSSLSRRAALRLLGAAAVAGPLLRPAGALAAEPFAPFWVQVTRPAPLWSGPDADALLLDRAAQWDYLRVVQPPRGGRLPVLVARSADYAWVDAAAVGPSGPPPAGWPAGTRPADGYGWVATTADTPLWGDAEGGLPLGIAPAWVPFRLEDAQHGPHLPVQDPFVDASVYLDAGSAGPVEAPERVPAPARWWGRVRVDGANLRSGPARRAEAPWQLTAGLPAVVSAWVAGDEVLPDNPTWARLADGAYVYSDVLRPAPLPSLPAPPVEAAGEAGHWFDVNLTLQVAVAYDAATPVYAARTSTGRPGWETPRGRFTIQRRVEKETMDSSTLLGQDAARADYRIENIRWAQYFTADGVAFHEAYWKPRDTFGLPSSHGCPGLAGEDARAFWDWAAIGTPVYVHA